LAREENTVTPKAVRWFGGALVLGILGLTVGAALYDIVAGEPDISNEVIALVAVGVVVLAAVALRVISRRRKRSDRKRSRRSGASRRRRA
jgi:hypothetical protein